MKFLVILFFLVSCTTRVPRPAMSQKANRPPASQQDPKDIFRLAKNSNIRDLSRWKLNEHEISFNGTIVKGDCKAFSNTIDNHTKTLRVNSSGGDAFEGLCIGREMLKRGFEKTIVTGLCVSSCANYLFLAPPNREIIYGIVGFHGNISALLKRDPQNKALKQQLSEAKISKREAQRIAQTFADDQRQNSQLEIEFLKQIGVSQDLFELTQEPDKGNRDDQDYTFLLPTPQTFEKYGIRNVIGTQNFELGQAIGMNNLVQ